MPAPEKFQGHSFFLGNALSSEMNTVLSKLILVICFYQETEILNSSRKAGCSSLAKN